MMLNVERFDESFKNILYENGLEAYYFSSKRDLIPMRYWSSFEQIWKSQWILNELYLNELEKISSELQVTALKGGALLRDVYTDVGSRFMSDLDLLISPENHNEAVSFLKSAGYQPLGDSKWWANDYKTVMIKQEAGRDLTVELHTKLFFSEPQVFRWSLEKSKYGNHYVLSPNDTVVHLAGHLAYQHNFLRLSWMLDIDLFIKKYANDLDWNFILERAAKVKQSKSMGAVLWALQRYFDAPIPEAVSKNCSAAVKANLTEDFLWNAQRRPVRYYLMKHVLKDSLWEAALYDYGWLMNKLGNGRHAN